MLTKSEFIYYVSAICIVLIILFLQPTLVGGILNYNYCGGKGSVNSTDGICMCNNGYYGRNCEFRYCPFGKAWYADPVQSNVKNMPYAECSNMGLCDTSTGVCSCREGFEGRGCERLGCSLSGAYGYGYSSADISTFPISGVSVQGFVDLSKTTGTESPYPIFENPGGVEINLVAASVARIQCHGRGRCQTMRELAKSFNGITSIRPPINYNAWDADRIMSCICDPGYEGWDCASRSCPKGRDPLAPASRTGVYKSEKYILQCQANAGYFSILFMGSYTQPIPHDAEPGLLKHLLESLEGVGTIRVEMKSETSDSLPAVCGSSSVVSTSIWLDGTFGASSPMFVTNATANTRVFPQGGTTLSHGGSTSDTVLRMATVHELHCPACEYCNGFVYFKYGDSVSEGVNITATYVETKIRSAILSLADFVNNKWPELSIAVNISSYNGAICDKYTNTTTTVTLYSTYGSIPSLEVIDGSHRTVEHEGSANLTWSSNGGSGTLYECSNQGYCDRQHGICVCLMRSAYGDLKYRAVSSDGNGGPGNRGDCGYIEEAVPSCYIAGVDACSGRGYCTNSTGLCTCYDGWFGMNCAVTQCPQGNAWFDEAISEVEAHQPAECSNMGICDRSTGTCKCRDGFRGVACEYLDCPRQRDGSGCSGRGHCMALRDIYQMFGLSYGSIEQPRLYPDTWDANSWRQCMCAAKTSAGFSGFIRTPLAGPRKPISGSSPGSPPLPGWSGWGCQWRNCPKGDNTDARHGYGGYTAIQRVVCPLGLNTTFKLQLFGQQSLEIKGCMHSFEIRRAIEYPASIGNVTVWFPNQDNDNITTACSPTAIGGFLVEFGTEFGDLPLMSVVDASNFTYSDHYEYGSNNTRIAYNSTITVEQYRKGTNLNLECGGPGMGYCDRNSGLCKCHDGYGSSNGTTGSPGNIGDCAYYSGLPTQADLNILGIATIGG